MKAGAKIIVKGLVQGVGYRYFCRKKADEYQISGYAKNLVNGDVELEVEGEKNMIEDFIKELKIGPFNSAVKKILVEELQFANKYDGFTTC